MGQFRENTKEVMKKWLVGKLPEPIIDLGGRGHREDTAVSVKQNFETWDLQDGRGVARVIDATRMEGVEDASIGTIICTSAMEHVSKPWAASAHIARVVRPGGRLFMSVPFKFNYHPAPNDYWRFTPDALRILFGATFHETKCDWFEPDGCFFFGKRKPLASESDAVMVAADIHGLITEAEVRFMFQSAMKTRGNGEIVELGTYLGKSCSVLCHVAAKWGKLPVTIDDYSYKNPCSPERVGKNLRAHGLNARIIKADSRKVPDGIDHVSVLFVDSFHKADHFNAEMDVWLPRVSRGGVIICDDYDHTKWKEMRAAIDARLGNLEKLGQETKMIAFRK